MSVGRFLICEKCKKSLLVGQQRQSIYIGVPETMEDLKDFLNEHESFIKNDHEPDHPLRLVPEYYQNGLPLNQEAGWEWIQRKKVLAKYSAKKSLFKKLLRVK